MWESSRIIVSRATEEESRRKKGSKYSGSEATWCVTWFWHKHHEKFETVSLNRIERRREASFRNLKHGKLFYLLNQVVNEKRAKMRWCRRPAIVLINYEKRPEFRSEHRNAASMQLGENNIYRQFSMNSLEWWNFHSMSKPEEIVELPNTHRVDLI